MRGWVSTGARALLLALLLAGAARARAQPDALPEAAPTPSRWWIESDASRVAPLARRARWRARLLRALEASAEPSEPAQAPPARLRPPDRSARGFDPARLSELRQLEARLGSAAQRRASLEEPEAMALLLDAERALLTHLDLPGLSPWYVELQLELAITASQMGQEALAEQSLRRAAAVDPERGLGAAEAPPALVASARRVAQELGMAARGRLLIEADVAGARVFWDDRELGEAPQEVRASPGPHLLRIEAPGHLPYGDLVELLPGERPPYRVALAEDLAVRAREALHRAGLAHDLDAAGHALQGSLGALFILEVGAGPEDRAALSRCDARGCLGPYALVAGEPLDLASELAPISARDLRSLAATRGWLAAPLVELDPGEEGERPPPEPIWASWPFWAGIGAAVLVGVGVAGAVLGTQEQPPSPLRIEVDPGDLVNP